MASYTGTPITPRVAGKDVSISIIAMTGWYSEAYPTRFFTEIKQAVHHSDSVMKSSIFYPDEL